MNKYHSKDPWKLKQCLNDMNRWSFADKHLLLEGFVEENRIGAPSSYFLEHAPFSSRNVISHQGGPDYPWWLSHSTWRIYHLEIGSDVFPKELLSINSFLHPVRSMPWDSGKNVIMGNSHLKSVEHWYGKMVVFPHTPFEICLEEATRAPSSYYLQCF